VLPELPAAPGYNFAQRMLRTPAYDGRDSEMMADTIPAA
jgi:hypothetical protein